MKRDDEKFVREAKSKKPRQPSNKRDRGDGRRAEGDVGGRDVANNWSIIPLAGGEKQVGRGQNVVAGALSCTV